MVSTRLFSYERLYNGILVHLPPEEWNQVLLPADAVVMKTGSGDYHPYWRLILEPEQTVEMLVGWFILPMSLDDALTWYETEMTGRGWVKSKAYRQDRRAGFEFEQVEPRIHVEMSFLDRPNLGDSTVMIRRYIKYPWNPAQANGVDAEEI